MPDYDDTLEAIFERARRLDDPANREAYLRRACGDNPALRKEVELLLRANDSPTGRLDPREGAEAETLVVQVPEGPGSTIGPYKLLQQIGEGGFGVVYMAEQREPIVRKVALKIIKLGMDTRNVIARFEAERQALAMMDHPNIAKVLDAGATEKGRPYFVMELVKGTPMTEFCDEHKLSTDERLELFIEVCGAVQHAHQKGIIHRDLKPSNVLVSLHEDDRPLPKIIDFGIAKAMQHRLTEKTLFTEFRQMIGTPAYMSPEQAQFSGLDTDTRSDIYSLGVLLYELLTGKTPFDNRELLSKGYEEICRCIREEEPPKPSTCWTTLARAEQDTRAKTRDTQPNELERVLRGDLDWIVMKALEKDRRRRYDTANAMRLDVRRFLDSEPVVAAAPSMAYQFKKFARRNRAALVMATIIATVLILATGISTWQAVRATKASASERRARYQAEQARVEATEQARRAQGSEAAMRQTSYEAEMNVAQQAIAVGNIDRAMQVLERHIPTPGQTDLRGFEWRYLWGQTHRERWTIQSETDPIWRLAMSPDGRLMAAGDRRGLVRIWDITRRQEVSQIKTAGGIYIWVDFSPNGETLAIGVNKSSEVILWDVRTQQEFHRFKAHSSGHPSLAFSPDGATLVIGSADGTLSFRDLSTGETQELKAHEEPITMVAFSNDSTQMVTSSFDGRVSVWDYPKREIRHTLEADGAPSFEADLSPNGEWVAAVPFRGASATVWNARSGDKVAELPFAFEAPSFALQFSPDSRTLAICLATGPMMLYETQTWQKITTYHHGGHQINTIAFSPADDLLLTAGDHGTISAWPAGPGYDQSVLKGPSWRITSLMFSPDGSMVAAGSSNGSVTLWDATSETELISTSPVLDQPEIDSEKQFGFEYFAFSPDSRHVAIGTTTEALNSVQVWDIRTKEVVREFRHNAGIHAIAYAPDGRTLATGTYLEKEDAEARNKRGVIRFWNLTTGKVIGPVLYEPGVVMCMAFSPDSRRLVTEGWGAQGFHVWDCASGELVATLKEHIEPVGDNHAVAFSPNGRLVATAGYDKKVILWDTETWQPTTTLLGHMAEVHDLSFSPDGKRLVSAGWDNVARLWNVETAQEVASFPGITVDFAPDGNTLAVGGMNNLPSVAHGPSLSVRLYRAPTLADIETRRDKESVHRGQ